MFRFWWYQTLSFHPDNYITELQAITTWHTPHPDKHTVTHIAFIWPCHAHAYHGLKWIAQMSPDCGMTSHLDYSAQDCPLTPSDNLWKLTYLATEVLSDSFEFICTIYMNFPIYLSIYLSNYLSIYTFTVCCTWDLGQTGCSCWHPINRFKSPNFKIH